MEKYIENFVINAKNTPGAENGCSIDDEYRNKGFVLASFEEYGIRSVMMHVTLAGLVKWISGDEKLLTAAKMAIMYKTLCGTKSSNDQSVSIEKLFGVEG